MLVTDSRQRASLHEIMNHPWMTKGYNGPPENFLPPREPLQLPLDPDVIQKMTGFDFGSPDYISTELTKVLESEEYQHAVQVSARQKVAQTPETERKRGVFDFYKRRNSTTSRDTLTNPSAETIQLGLDPVSAYSPLISVYFLVREKMQREKAEANPGALSIQAGSDDKPFQMPDLPAPEAAYTNPASYELAGEAPTGGRSRPRARTRGEEDAHEAGQHSTSKGPVSPASPAIITPPNEYTPARKESTAAGLLRRFSTRRHKEPDREKSVGPPSLNISGPNDSSSNPRKSFSVRRPREKETPASLKPPSEIHQPELLSPPSVGAGATKKLKALGRSTSVNSAELRRRLSRRGAGTKEPPATSGSDRSSISQERGPTTDAASEDIPLSSRTRGPASRAKSLGHARRESIQARRVRREMARETDVPEETDADGVNAGETRSPETMKPVYLKGLFSVSTTSSKPLTFIRADIIRVLRQLGVEYHEMKGGFSCRHSPSIDLNTVQDPVPNNTHTPNHRRKISFGGFISSDRDRDRERDEFREQHKSPKSPRQRKGAPPIDTSFTNSEASDESDGRDDPRLPSGPRPAGETSTHVQSDLGGSMVLKFEVLIVKVPLLSLHGIQFKKVDGGTWQYKNMAQKILDELRL
jgi:serine/threonine protein kinase KIN1/2